MLGRACGFVEMNDGSIVCQHSCPSCGSVWMHPAEPNEDPGNFGWCYLKFLATCFGCLKGVAREFAYLSPPEIPSMESLEIES